MRLPPAKSRSNSSLDAPEICLRLDATDERALPHPGATSARIIPQENATARERSRAELNTSPGGIQPQFPFALETAPLYAHLARLRHLNAIFIAALPALASPPAQPEMAQIPARSCNS